MAFSSKPVSGRLRGSAVFLLFWEAKAENVYD